MARIDESRAVLRAAKANQLPRVDANVSASRQRFGENAPLTIGGNQLTFNDFRANLSVAYEVDLWSRAANLSAAARDELLASEYARDTLRTALAAQVVQSYATLQSLDAQVVLFGQAVQAQRDSLKLQRMRFNAGDISELDIEQLDAELIDNEAQLPKLDRARGEAERALALVLGRSPKDLVEQGVVRSDTPTLRASGVPEGLPSDLLLRRPDVQAAEARLRAAGARVDAARAAYFPGITLTAAYGFESTQLHEPVRWAVAGLEHPCRADAADLGRRAHRRAIRRHAGAPHAGGARLPRQRRGRLQGDAGCARRLQRGQRHAAERAAPRAGAGRAPPTSLASATTAASRAGST